MRIQKHTVLLCQTSWALFGDREHSPKLLWESAEEAEEACLCDRHRRDEEVRDKKGGQTHRKSLSGFCLHLLSEQRRQDVRSRGGYRTEESPGSPTVWTPSPACCLRCQTPTRCTHMHTHTHTHTHTHKDCVLPFIGHCNTRDVCNGLSTSGALKATLCKGFVGIVCLRLCIMFTLRQLHWKYCVYGYRYHMEGEHFLYTAGFAMPKRKLSFGMSCFCSPISAFCSPDCQSSTPAPFLHPTDTGASAQ